MYLIMFVTGLLFGSFYNVLGIRLPKEESIVYPGSHCVSCNHKLGFWDLIPVFSYIFLRGKCHYCKEKISFRYPFFELVTAIYFVLCYYIFGLSLDLVVSLIFGSALIIITISDLDTFIIPDSVLIVGSVAILIVYIFQYKTLVFNRLLDGICSFALMFLLKKIGNFLFKKESMGDGDIKLMALIGFVLGFPNAICTLFLAAYLGLPYSIYVVLKKEKAHEIPFGPYLGLAALIILLFKFDFLTFISSLR